MAFEKFAPAASGATHAKVAASVVDVLMPHTELAGTTANLLRSAGYGLGGYIFRGYREGKGFSLS